MTSEQIKKFKFIFEEQKQKILNSQKMLNDSLNLQKDDLLDDMDLTSTEMEQAMQIRLKKREMLFLKKINDSLERIKKGTFGECKSCGDEIELSRLEARPTAEVCISCKETQERKEKIHNLSNGYKLKVAF